MSDEYERARISSYDDIGGWFTAVDKFVFDAILASQDEHGTLVELGAYLGRSAVVIGDHQRSGERFVVIDLFGGDAGLGHDTDDEANRRENAGSYTALSRERFEQNYLALHDDLPEVVSGLSTLVADHVAAGSARFVHIDASHMYDKVAEDIAIAATLMKPDGVAVLDDFRSPHTPGVAAATWEAVREGGLKPFVITPHKLYGTWGDPHRYREIVTSLAYEDPTLAVNEQSLREHTIARIFAPKPNRRAAAQAAREKAELVEKQRLAAAQASETAMPRRATIARDWTPPAVARWAHKHRTKCDA